jgi:hypothetical protein
MRRLLWRGPKNRLSEDSSNLGSTPSTSMAAASARKSFPRGIKPLYDTEDSVVEYVKFLSNLCYSTLFISRRFATLLTRYSPTSIIFIHGLTGDREKTWTVKNAAASWPQSLLPSKIPNARVLTFGYDAYVVDWQGVVSENKIGNHAMNLLSSVAGYREEDDTVCLGGSWRFETEIDCSRTNALSYLSVTVLED